MKEPGNRVKRKGAPTKKSVEGDDKTGKNLSAKK